MGFSLGCLFGVHVIIYNYLVNFYSVLESEAVSARDIFSVLRIKRIFVFCFKPDLQRSTISANGKLQSIYVFIVFHVIMVV
jgi:hypothetical protein